MLKRINGVRIAGTELTEMLCTATRTYMEREPEKRAGEQLAECMVASIEYLAINLANVSDSDAELEQNIETVNKQLREFLDIWRERAGAPSTKGLN